MIKFSTLGVKSTPKVLLVNYKLVKLHLFRSNVSIIVSQLQIEMNSAKIEEVRTLGDKVIKLLTSERLKDIVTDY